MKIYTKTGDEGQTGLIGGARIDKDDPAVEAFGALDELNSAIGLVRARSSESPLDFLLERLQRLVFEVGAEVASPPDHVRSQEAALGTIVTDLERSMDIQESMLPELKNFVLPGGSELGARLHWARCMARRAERRIVALGKSKELRPELLVFLNRLSDWMFLAARTANHESGLPEPVWNKDT